MAFNIKASIQAVQSHLAASGYVRSAMVGEPKSPPSTRQLAGSVQMASAAVVATTLADTIELHTIIVRVYHISLSDNPEDTEYDLAEAVSAIMEDFAGDFQLGGTIRNVDVAGQYGTAMGAEWGYLEVGSVMFRVVDVTLPLIVDGSASLVA